MDVVPQLIVSTVLLGGIYALIAVGLTLIFGVMRVVNFAHGEFLMLAMYGAFFAFSLLHFDPYVTLVVSLPLFFALAWAVGITCVGAAGVLLSPIYPVYPTAGLQFVLIAYVAVVLGGLGDMAGALIAALVVAAVEVVGSYVIGTAWKEVLYLLLFIAVLIVRPAGLFGQRGAEALGT